VPRWYDAVASPCHLFSRDHDHVAETSQADHYRAPCGNRRIAPLVPTSVSWDDRCIPLSYKKGNPPACCNCQVSPAFEPGIVAALVFPSASFCQPATSPSLSLLRPGIEPAVYPSSSTTSRRSSKKTERRTPSSIVDHASIRGDVRVPPLDACSDVPLHCRRSLSSFNLPCTHPSLASSLTALRQ
jgi:hypothetical protein